MRNRAPPLCAQGQIENLTKDTAALRKANVTTARDTAEFVVYLQDDIERKEQSIRQLRDKLRDVEFGARQEIQRLSQEHEQHVEALNKTAQERQSELETQIGQLQQQLATLSEFQEHKSRHDSELEAVRELLDTERKRRQRETAEMQRRMLGLKSDWREARQAEYAAMQAQARGEAQRLVSIRIDAP